MRCALLFFALCSLLDEVSTFVHLSLGNMELNSVVAWLISVNPLLYTLYDATVVLIFWVIDRVLKSRVDLWLVWAFAGAARLICFSWNLVSLVLLK